MNRTNIKTKQQKNTNRSIEFRPGEFFPSCVQNEVTFCLDFSCVRQAGQREMALIYHKIMRLITQTVPLRCKHTKPATILFNWQ